MTAQKGDMDPRSIREGKTRPFATDIELLIFLGALGALAVSQLLLRIF